MSCSHMPRLSRRNLLTAGAGAASLSLLSGCATNPATGGDSFTGFYSIEDDIRLGQQEYPNLIEAFGGAYESGSLQSYVTRIGRDLASRSELPELPWEFTVLNSPIVNAMALPGGKIGLTRGLLALASNEAEVAGVTAHEIGHVTARHTAQRQSRGMLANLGLAVLGAATGNSQIMQLGQTVAAGYLQSYSREQEFQSDTLGVRYMTRAGYDPDAMATFLASLREHSQLDARQRGLPPGSVDQSNMMASHPRTIDRVRRAQAEASAAPVAEPRVNREGYLNAINGLIFADDPDQGIVRDRSFLHGQLKLAFDVPDGFVLRNGTEQVVAEHQSGAVIIFDGGRVQQARTLTGYLQDEWTAGVRLNQVEQISVNGIPAATGTTRMSTDGGPADIRLVVYQWDGPQVFRFMFVAPSREAAAFNTGFRTTTYSLRRLTDTEAASLQPLRLITAPAMPGDTIEGLARSLPYGAFNEDWFRMLNDLPANAPLPIGPTLKIVAG